MNNHSRLKYFPHTQEYLFTVNSSELEADIDYIRVNKINSLQINARPNSGYELNHIDWLEAVSGQVEKLTITTAEKGGFFFNGLSSCKKLTTLIIFNYTHGLIDVSHNLGLNTISIEDSKSLVGLEMLGRLKTTVLNKLPPDFQTSARFSKLQELEYLCLSRSDVSQGIAFLADTRLEKLCFYGCKKLNLAGIEKIGIKELKIEKSKTVQSFNSIFNVTTMTQLSLIDSDNIQSADLVLRLRNLKTLIILGSSAFVDGDIAKLANQLDVFNFDDKKHYNLKYEK